MPPCDRWYHQSVAHWHYTMWSCFWGSGHSPFNARRYWPYDRSSGATIDRTTDRLWLPLVVRSSPIDVDRATTRTTNRRWPTTRKKDRLQYEIAAGDRSKHCRSVARSPHSNRSYDQAIVRSGVTVALATHDRPSWRALVSYAMCHATQAT